jgi:hypothetical protein
MALINMGDVYASIHKSLREDAEILRLLGITAPADLRDSAFLAKMATRIQKRKKPQNTMTANYPLISFYNNPGWRGTNELEYVVAFDFDIYTADDVDTAIWISDRITSLFEKRFIDAKCVESSQSQFLSSAEADTDQPNTYKYFTQVLFTTVLNE